MNISLCSVSYTHLFYNHQEGVFANACSYILQGLDADSISEIYKQLPGSDLFTSEKSYYQQRVQETVKAWSESQEGAKLIKAWKDATKTESPRAWSQAYLMPVLCMVDDPSDCLLYTSLGVRGAVAYKLRDRFTFSGPVITPKGKAMNMIDIFAMFCQRHTPFTLDDLAAFAKECDSTI